MKKHCLNCSYHYGDGFCMQNCFYTDDEHTCPSWTDQPIKFDYKRIHYLCKQYLEICRMYEDTEKLKSEFKHPFEYENSLHNLEFFLNCCLNDLHREMSLWRTRR